MNKLTVFLLVFNVVIAYGQPKRLEGINLDHLTVREKTLASETGTKILQPKTNNPDEGIIPFDGPPCKNCFEDISKRDAFFRYFFEANSNRFFIQQASSPINYRDE